MFLKDILNYRCCNLVHYISAVYNQAASKCVNDQPRGASKQIKSRTYTQAGGQQTIIHRQNSLESKCATKQSVSESVRTLSEPDLFSPSRALIHPLSHNDWPEFVLSFEQCDRGLLLIQLEIRIPFARKEDNQRLVAVARLDGCFSYLKHGWIHLNIIFEEYGLPQGGQSEGRVRVE